MTQKIIINDLKPPQIPGYDSDATLILCNGKVQWIRDIPAPTFQGESTIFWAGGFNNCIQSVPIAADGTASAVGTLCARAYAAAASRSETHSYIAGSYNYPTFTGCIQKYPMSGGSITSSLVGQLVCCRRFNTGFTAFNDGYGYSRSGTGANTPGSPYYNGIEKFPFASDANATCVGDMFNDGCLNRGVEYVGVGNSNAYAYSGGQLITPSNASYTDKWPFASEGTSTCIGTISPDLYLSTDASSGEDAYLMGGYSAPGNVAYTTIFGFPFAAETGNFTSVGSLATGGWFKGGASGKEYGYSAGGCLGPPNGAATSTTNIDKFPFSLAPQNATDVGDLIAISNGIMGSQV